MKRNMSLVAGVCGIGVLIAVFVWQHTSRIQPKSERVLRIAIAPYQDLAMLVNAESTGEYKRRGIKLQLLTMGWEEILPAVASAGPTVDVGFGSYVEYLTKYSKLNVGSGDPVIYFQPLYVYKGGGFIALRKDIKPFSASDLCSAEQIARLRRFRIGAQKESLYDMMIYSVAARGGLRSTDLQVFDTPMNDGLLALQAGSLDISAAGLTQVTEVEKRGGRIVISMEDAGFADVTGFICRKSTLETRRADLEALVEMWFASVDYVMSDLRKNSAKSLAYLRANAATQYSFDEYKRALSQELLPRSTEDLRREVLAKGAKYDFIRIGNEINAYLVANKVVAKPTELPRPLLGAR